MRLIKFSSLILLAAAALSTGTALHSQSSTSPASKLGNYIASDPLAGVKYDNKYDVYVGAAYVRFMPGPNAVIGDNIGGLDVSGSYWFSKHFGIEASNRYYLGTAGAPPAAHKPPYSINGPFVSQDIFVAGIEALGPHNKHGAFFGHAMFGGAYGKFEQDLRNTPRDLVGFYSDGIGPAAVIGGHIDLNRSPRWVFRITPDALMTRYSTNYESSITAPKGSYTNWNFGISVGMEYKFKAKR